MGVIFVKRGKSSKEVAYELEVLKERLSTEQLISEIAEFLPTKQLDDIVFIISAEQGVELY